MTFNDVREFYKQEDIRCQWLGAAPMNYSRLREMSIDAMKEQFGFTSEQATRIFDYAAEKYHSCYDNVIENCVGLCYFLKAFPY